MSPPHIRVLHSADAIAARVAVLGAALAETHATLAPLILGTLTGAFMFTADLVRAMTPHPPGLSVDFLRASSYSGTTSTGTVTVGASGGLGTKVPIAGRHIILVEDIVDSGRTLAALRAALASSGAASVTAVTLLDKPSGRAAGGQAAAKAGPDAAAGAADHVGFTLEGDDFVVGYGLDWDEAWRGLPYVGVVEGEGGEGRV